MVLMNQKTKNIFKLIYINIMSQNAIILILVAVLYIQYQKINNLSIQQTKAIQKVNNIENEIRLENNNYKEKEIQRNNDMKVLTDPLTPGKKRMPRHLENTHISTRGTPDNFQYVGNLVRETDEKIIPVFARQDYPGSDYYEYYMMINNNGNFGIKIPINNSKKRKEMEAGEIVKIDYFNEDNGDFVFKEFELDAPRYDPYNY